MTPTLPKPSGVVTLLTDFGLRDPFVGVMKGVLHRQQAGLSLVDLTHGIEQGDIRAGAFWLAKSASYFPEGSVHLAVVDPGVGTERGVVVAYAAGQYFVGPDNGLLVPALVRSPDYQAVLVDVERLMPPTRGHTFHGRDVFAPLAAYLASGTDPLSLGALADALVEPPWSQPRREGNRIFGEIVVVDHFGNLISNVELAEDDLVSAVRCEGRQLPWGKTYGDVDPGHLVALCNSWDCVEVAARGGSARRQLGASEGARIEVELSG